MSVRAFWCFLFLVTILTCSGTLVRVSYDGSRVSSPQDLLQLVKHNNASHIKISDENQKVFGRVCNSNLNVDLYVSMKNMRAISKSTAFAVAWVHREVLSLTSCTDTMSIVLSSEFLTENQLPLVLPALKAIKSALVSLKLDKSIKLSASCNLSLIENHWTNPLDLSAANIREILLQVVDFLHSSRSYLTVDAFCIEQSGFGDCLLSVVKHTYAALSSHNVPLQINIRSPQVSGFINKVEVADKLLSLMEKRDHVSDQLHMLHLEKSFITDAKHKELKLEEYSNPSFRRALTGSKVQLINNTPQLDVITPLTTIPVVNPTTIPTVDPTISPATPTTTPITSPITIPVTSPASSDQSWCIASQTASEIALQVALDYACGYGAADCASILQGGNCYEPNTIRDHASYAFNNYYQKNPVATSCNFGGTAVLTNINPSTLTCQYASTSTSSSVLNTSSTMGATVFGSVPTGPSASNASSMPLSLSILFILACHVLVMVTATCL